MYSKKRKRTIGRKRSKKVIIAHSQKIRKGDIFFELELNMAKRDFCILCNIYKDTNAHLRPDKTFA